MKLSKAQQRIVDYMKNGYELGHMSDINGRYWLQKPGLGRGGDSIDVNRASIHALINKGIICWGKHSFPWTKLYLKAND